MFFILDEHHGLVPASLEEWAAMIKDTDARRVGLTKVGDVTVSTVFLGFDHGFGRRRLFFETMTFGGPYDHLEVARYETWQEAEAGHRLAVGRLMSGMDPVDD